MTDKEKPRGKEIYVLSSRSSPCSSCFSSSFVSLVFHPHQNDSLKYLLSPVWLLPLSEAIYSRPPALMTHPFWRHHLQQRERGPFKSSFDTMLLFTSWTSLALNPYKIRLPYLFTRKWVPSPTKRFEALPFCMKLKETNHSPLQYILSRVAIPVFTRGRGVNISISALKAHC